MLLGLLGLVAVLGVGLRRLGGQPTRSPGTYSTHPDTCALREVERPAQVLAAIARAAGATSRSRSTAARIFRDDVAAGAGEPRPSSSPIRRRRDPPPPRAQLTRERHEECGRIGGERVGPHERDATVLETPAPRLRPSRTAARGRRSGRSPRTDCAHTRRGNRRRRPPPREAYAAANRRASRRRSRRREP